MMPFRKLLVLFILIFYIPRIFCKVSSNQIIYFSHPKPKSQFIYFLISIILGKKIVYDFYYSLYMRVANEENLNFFQMLNYWSLKLIEKTILIKSDVVIFPNKSEANSIEKLFNIDLTQKIVIIPLIKKAIINELQFRYFKNKDEKLNLVCIGDPNQIHNIKCVVDSVKKLSNYNLKPKLFIVIPNKILVKNFTSSLHLGSIDYEFVYGLTNLDESLNKFVCENCHVSFGHLEMICNRN